MKALISLLSLAAVLVVGSCGVADSSSSTSYSGAATSFKVYQSPNGWYDIYSWCIGKDKMYLMNGKLEALADHKECP